MLEIENTAISEVRILIPKRFFDARGMFSETYNKKRWSEAGISQEFVQDNYSFSKDQGVVRGLHFQVPPFAQAKLVRVIHGSIFDVAVDLRRSSPTFGKWVKVVLNAEDWKSLYIPVGFAHGLCTLEPCTEVQYKVTNLYSIDHERGVLWNDPQIGIDWPISFDQAKLSDKDWKYPPLMDLVDLFD